MKKISLLLLLCMMPTFAFAALTSNLSYGMTGESVVELQQFLITDGYLTGTATGNFYSLTRAAVEKYQSAKGITPTGTVGPLTRAAIAADEAAGTSSSASTTVSAAPVTPPVSAAPAALTGTLTLVPSTASPVLTATPAATKAKLADLTLTNGTSESVNLKTIEADYTVGSDNLFPASNVYVVYNGVTSGWNTSSADIWSVSGLVPSGGSIDISLYGDIDPSFSSGAVVASSIIVTGVTATTGTSMTANANASVSIAQNSLSVTAGPNLPAATIIYTAEKKLPAGAFTLTSVGAPYTVSDLKFVVPTAPIPAGSALSAPAAPIVTDGTLIDAATGTALTNAVPVTYNGSNYIIDFSNLKVSVPAGGAKSLNLQYDVGAVASSAQANINISPVLAYVKATTGNTTVDGAASAYPAIPVFDGDSIVLPSNGVTVNSIYAFKSLPSVSSQAAAATATSETGLPLYTFTVSAASTGGAVAFKQIMFNVTLSDPNGHYPLLQNFSLLKNGSNYGSAVQIGDLENNQYTPLSGTSGLGVGTYPVVVTFVNEETIPAGVSNTYTLKADGADFIGGSAYPTVVTSVAADGSPSTNGSYLRSVTGVADYGLDPSPGSLTAATTYNFLWSDKSATYPPHSDTNGLSSGDWYDGFGVFQSLPVETLSVNIHA